MTSSFQNSIYPQSFLCEEAKFKQYTSSKKELCEIGEKYMGIPIHMLFLILYGVVKKGVFSCITFLKVYVVAFVRDISTTNLRKGPRRNLF